MVHHADKEDRLVCRPVRCITHKTRLHPQEWRHAFDVIHQHKGHMNHLAVAFIDLLQHTQSVYPIWEIDDRFHNHIHMKLLSRCHEDHQITAPLTADVNGYRIEYTIAQDSRQMYAESVIFACGGPAGDHLGAGDFGFRELRRLGLTVSEPHPALVPLLLSNKNAKTVSGVRLDAEVTIDTAGESNDLPEAGSEKGISSGLGLPKIEFGEVVWTDYGISGIPVMQLSRFAEEALSCGKKVLIRLNFLRDMSNEEALREVMRRTREEAFSERDIEHAMDGLVPSKLMYIILLRAGVSPQKPAREITPDEARRIHKELTDMTLPVTGTRPFAYAQAARGGVSLSEINPDTCECVRFPGLYVTGELLDMDGNCGGYNLQWAFATGAIAGRNA